MSFRRLKSGLALGVSLAVSSFSHAQLPQIPVLGDVLAGLGGGLPGLGALANVGAGAGADLPGLDALPLPGLDALTTAGLPGLDALPLPGLDALPLPAGGGDVAGLSGLLDALPLLSSETPQLPGVNALLSIVNGLGSGGIPGADMLPLVELAAVGSGDITLPGLEALQLDLSALSDYATLGKVETSVAAVETFVNSIAENPQSLAGFGSQLGPDTVFAMVPLLGAIKDDPAALPDYFTAGGTVLSSEMHLLPPLPLVNQPLEL
ncbi:hypothetical protein [Spongiibacter sp.]|uniref:hypothetical protein n=1 Tax=Spongiibacter sp. TaxID=2024860 RepID=UPI0035678E88